MFIRARLKNPLLALKSASDIAGADVKSLLCFAGGILLLLLLLLSSVSVFQVSEAREGSVVQEILNTGNIVLPLRSGEYIPSKPILFHWLGSLGASATSIVGEYELRLPSALAAVATIVVLMLSVLPLSGRICAIAVGAICFSHYGFIRLATDGRVDMLFCFFCTASLLVWLRSFIDNTANNQRLRDIPERVYSTAGILLGCAVLTKGPLSIVLVAAIVVVILVVLRGIGELLALLRPGLLWCLIVPLPWYLSGSMIAGEPFIERHLFFENVARLVGDVLITPKPWYFYLRHFWTQAAPWSFVFLALILLLLGKMGWRMSKNIIHNSLSQRELLLLKSSVLWCLTTVVLLSIASGKRRAYLLTMLPAFSIVVMYFLAALYRNNPLNFPQLSSCYRATRILCATSIFLLLLLVIVPLTGVEVALFSKQSVLLSFAGYRSLLSLKGMPYFLAIALSLLFGFFAYRRSLRLPEVDRLYHAALCLWWLFVGGFVALVFSGLVAKSYGRSYEPFAEIVASSLASQQRLNVVKLPYDESIDGFLFYYKQPLAIVDGSIDKLSRGVYLARQLWLEFRLPQWRSQVSILARGGRRIDEKHEELILFELPETLELAKVPQPTRILAPAW